MSENTAWTEFQVAGDEAGMRLDLFLARRFDCSRSRAARLLGRVYDGRGRPFERFSRRLRAGELVRVMSVRHAEPPVEVRYRLLYQDAWLVAVNKEAGAPVHPSHGIRRNTLLGRLSADLRDESLMPVHRLDRETSGVVVFGRGKEATARLMRLFASGEAEKTYLALVRGSPSFEKCRVDLPLARDRAFPVHCRMRVDATGGKPASTELTVLVRLKDCALVQARPLTGRQHQIRVHLASLGHPVLGDKLYQFQGRYYLAMLEDGLDENSYAELGHRRQALCAWRLSFRHPFTGERLCLQAHLAKDFLDLLEKYCPGWSLPAYLPPPTF